MSVTPRACARVAPAIVVADLERSPFMKLAASLLLFTQLFLLGCVSNNQPPSRPMFSFKRVTPVAAAARSERTLAREHSFIRNGGGALLGGARLTLLAGVYTVVAADDEGTYWEHRDRGILR